MNTLLVQPIALLYVGKGFYLKSGDATWVRGWNDDHDARPDGIHWSPEAATELATDFLGPALVHAALRT